VCRLFFYETHDRFDTEEYPKYRHGRVNDYRQYIVLEEQCDRHDRHRETEQNQSVPVDALHP
jgi:hypothetical protein